MDSGQNRKLTVEEAKERLRKAGDGLGVLAWTRSHPAEAMIFAFAFGFLASSDKALRRSLTTLLPLLLRIQ